ncbi:MAG: FAD-binding oxidoreductase [Anaerolineae bacterium]|nr:FAD-binding oxidoreductase [Anaerolineae bacterium]
MSPSPDLLILGGGVHGASLAYHLSARGVNVAVIEKRHLAAGATGRSSGLVRMHYDLETEAASAPIPAASRARASSNSSSANMWTRSKSTPPCSSASASPPCWSLPTT